MKLRGASFDYVFFTAESVGEAGLMSWLATRFKGQTVTFDFDTTTTQEEAQHPALWVRYHGQRTKEDGQA